MYMFACNRAVSMTIVHAIVPFQVRGDGACQFRAIWEQLQFADDKKGHGARVRSQEDQTNMAHQFTPYRLRLFAVMKMLQMALYVSCLQSCKVNGNRACNRATDCTISLQNDEYYKDLVGNITGEYGSKSKIHSGPFTVFGYML